MRVFLFILLLITLLGTGGCLSLSQEEQSHLKELDNRGYSLKTPPAGFSAPADETTAAGLNFLPGVGNAYLARKKAGRTQWAVGIGNLLLWPISPIWSVAEGYQDAKTLNRRALAKYWSEHPELAEKPLRPTTPPTQATLQNEFSPPVFATKQTIVSPYGIETIQPYSLGKALYRVTIHNESLTAFDVERLVRPEIERILRMAFAAENPGVSDSSIRAYAIPDFGNDRTLLFSGRVFSIEPVEDGWNYNPNTRCGWVRLRIFGGMSAEDAKRWARENISAIVADKNVVIETGKALPSGRHTAASAKSSKTAS